MKCAEGGGVKGMKWKREMYKGGEWWSRTLTIEGLTVLFFGDFFFSSFF